MMRTRSLPAVAVILLILVYGNVFAARPVKTQQPVPEPPKEVISPEEHTHIQTELAKARAQIDVLRSLNVRDDDLEREYIVCFIRLKKLGGTLAGPDVHREASRLLVQIDTLTREAESRITMAKRINLLYILMTTFGLFLIIGVTGYFAWMYLRRK